MSSSAHIRGNKGASANGGISTDQCQTPHHDVNGAGVYATNSKVELDNTSVFHNTASTSSWRAPIITATNPKGLSIRLSFSTTIDTFVRRWQYAHAHFASVISIRGSNIKIRSSVTSHLIIACVVVVADVNVITGPNDTLGIYAVVGSLNGKYKYQNAQTKATMHFTAEGRWALTLAGANQNTFYGNSSDDPSQQETKQVTVINNEWTATTPPLTLEGACGNYLDLRCWCDHSMLPSLYSESCDVFAVRVLLSRSKCGLLYMPVIRDWRYGGSSQHAPRLQLEGGVRMRHR